ncbi:hypothetical protein WG902_14940 [Ramlibacter sp. PS3R-8]|uniref:hypothetical protein n=1 Tax=Ramlibacter sp. PS3R-8 TaxID=3133437 RepID=UPI0030A0DEEE
MDYLLPLAIALAAGCWIAKTKVQHQRIALLASFLSPYSIEKNIETVTQGYLRALGEAEPGRREQVLYVLRGNEQDLCRQMGQLADDVASADPEATRVSKLPIWLPFALAFAPSFDLREALRVHARGICRAIEAEGAASPKDRAFAITAELLLMQHTCHWFCRSKAVASARMQARHRTSHEQLAAAVLPQTRSEYLGLVALARSA